MKKNKMMRLASLLLVMVLMTTCVIGGTFAKYTSTATSSDTARVANWGFEAVSMDLTGLFATTYETHTDGFTGDTVISANTTDLIAPGTSGFDTFQFAYDQSAGINAPEVAYTFEVSTEGSSCAQSIQDNNNIVWALDHGTYGTWTQLIASIKALSGDASGSKDYAPGNLPEAFSKDDNVHTVSWMWLFETTGDAAQDETDTAMGNANELAEVELVITITATKIN